MATDPEPSRLSPEALHLLDHVLDAIIPPADDGPQPGAGALGLAEIRQAVRANGPRPETLEKVQENFDCALAILEPVAPRWRAHARIANFSCNAMQCVAMQCK